MELDVVKFAGMNHFASTVRKQRIMNIWALAHFSLFIQSRILGHGTIHCGQGFLLE